MEYEKFWHSSSHLLAAAVRELYGDVVLGIGPAISEGFYYDFDYSFKEEDLPKIEKKMKELVKKNLKFEHSEISKVEARELFSNQPLKLELISEIPNEKVSIYKLGNFIDLCSGPHLDSVGKIKAFKLLRLAGAYWKGSEKNKMLSRIYGISFASDSELKEYLQKQEEAKQRNHLKIGKELDLFSFHPESPGMVFFHPSGAHIYNSLVSFARELQKKYRYNEIITPQILSVDLWKISGHYEHYEENMYFTKIDDKDFAVKPMNCPGHVLVYKNSKHSYREFPLKLSEFGVVHRHERSGVLNGLFRLRRFTQDDAHIFCTKEQIENEIEKVISFISEVYSVFGFSYEVELSTRPLKKMGSEELWDLAENKLENVLKKNKIKYTLNKGDGAFYGPKIDFHIYDALKRKWQCATIQLDFQMPERFDLSFVNSKGEEEKPIMIHHTVLGSVERFTGILIEHFKGLMPFWLSSSQIAILPLSDSQLSSSQEIFSKFSDYNSVLISDGSLGKRIRDAQMQKFNYIIVLGDKEISEGKLAVRLPSGKQISVSVSDFLAKISKEKESRSLKSFFE